MVMAKELRPNYSYRTADGMVFKVAVSKAGHPYALRWDRALASDPKNRWPKHYRRKYIRSPWVFEAGLLGRIDVSTIVEFKIAGAPVRWEPFTLEEG